MRFADLDPGRVFKNGPISLTEAEIIDFARAWDPQPFHVDPEKARASHWGGVIASGWQTTGVGMRLFCDAVLAGSEAMGSPGIDVIKFLLPVRPGDAIRLEATVLERRRSASKPHLGIVKWRWQLFNQRDDEVYFSQSTVLFALG